MTLKESGDYKYILYLMDHFPKFHCLSPLPRKASANVNTALTGICGTIGLPNIIQTDNGSEFSKLEDIYSGVILVYIYCYLSLPEEDYGFPVRLAAQTCDN